MTRLDEELVRRGLAPSVDAARRLVLAGEVSGASERYGSPATPVSSDAPLHVRATKPYVSRGGLKLEGALTAFDLDVSGLRCVDVGASTGGFTDCLLKAGAASVTAVDVAYGQFAWELRADPRVELLERTNARALAGDPAREHAYDLVVMDVSFASAATFADLVAYLLAPSGRLLCLVKPQFEATPEAIDAHGVVRAEAVRAEAVAKVSAAFAAHGLEVTGVVPAPVTGAKGNQEYVLSARPRMAG